MPTWEWLVRVVRHWDAIEELLRERPEGPWVYVLNERNLVEVPLPPAS